MEKAPAVSITITPPAKAAEGEKGKEALEHLDLCRTFFHREKVEKLHDT